MSFWALYVKSLKSTKNNKNQQRTTFFFFYFHFIKVFTENVYTFHKFIINQLLCALQNWLLEWKSWLLIILSQLWKYKVSTRLSILSEGLCGLWTIFCVEIWGPPSLLLAKRTVTAYNKGAWFGYVKIFFFNSAYEFFYYCFFF